MKVKLRIVNGAQYMLLKKEIRELLGIDKEVNIQIESNKIIITAIKENEVK